jgi:IPT/TIG domain
VNKKLFLISFLSVMYASPALAEDVVTLAESKPFVATSDAVQRTSEFISLPKGQEKLKLTLTYYNGSSTAPSFTVLRVSSPSMNYVTEKSFAGQKSLVTDVTGDLSWGGNQIMITARGPKGAEFGWKLTTPKPTITSITPQTISAGGTVTLNGNNLSSDILSDDVQVNNQKVHCISANSTEIVFQVPENINGGPNSVSLNVAGLGGGTAPLNVDATPILKSLSRTWAPIGGEVTIYGDGFGSNPANISVFMGPLRAPIVSSTPTSITITTPDGFAGMPWGANQPLHVAVNGVKARNTLILSSDEISDF